MGLGQTVGSEHRIFVIQINHYGAAVLSEAGIVFETLGAGIAEGFISWQPLGSRNFGYITSSQISVSDVTTEKGACV